MRKFLTLAAAAAAVLVSGAAQAVPYMVLTLEATGANAATRTCSTFSLATQIQCGVDGFTVFAFNNVAFAGIIGGFEAKLQGASSNTPGTAAQSVINMSFQDLQNRNAGLLATFRLTGTAYGFTLPSGPAMSLFGSQSHSANADPGASMTSVQYANRFNVDPVGAGTSVSTTCTNALATNASCASPTVMWTRDVGAFSLADQITFVLAQGADGVNGGSNVTARRVPEPMTTALVGLGLFGAAFFSRRRKAVTV